MSELPQDVPNLVPTPDSGKPGAARTAPYTPDGLRILTDRVSNDAASAGLHLQDVNLVVRGGTAGDAPNGPHAPDALAEEGAHAVTADVTLAQLRCTHGPMPICVPVNPPPHRPIFRPPGRRRTGA
jgi:hypothetical protein